MIRSCKSGRVALLFAVVGGVMIASCGKKAPPRPPAPRGPLPPRGVEARQLGPDMLVTFQVPKPRGSSPAQEPARVDLVRIDYGPGLEAPADPDAFRRRGSEVQLVTRDRLEPGERMTLVDSTWTRLADGGVGWTLRYAVRVRDRRGRPSALVVSRDVVAVEIPEPPSDLTAEPTADGIRLAWAPPDPQGTFDYNLYRADGEDPFPERPMNGQPLGVPEFLDTSVEIGNKYRYGVRTAIGDLPPYRESVSSPEVLIVADDRFPPAPPADLVAVQEGAAIRLFWDPGTEKDISGYRVYRRVGSSSWERVGPNPVLEPLFLDTEVEADQRLTYRVTAVDRASPPNESGPSSTVEVLVAEDSAHPGSKAPRESKNAPGESGG